MPGRGVRLAVWWLVFLAGLAPLLWLAWALPTNRLGFEPVVDSLRFLGQTAIWLLMIGLAITPLGRLIPSWRLVDYRRMVGLYAFFYASLHVAVWLVVDRQLDWRAIVEEITERLHIGFGALAFLLLVPLAVTSTKGWMRRLGAGWRELHRLVYPATGLAVLHYFLSVKLDTRTPLLLMALLLVLLAARPLTRRWAGKHRRR
ncbi:sulfite oxidase heme-binding subunit YedZ [Guyparkeria sp.]|uniref:sulfite oxidase heme-binding subunit YedZ n=1 Tax=Guyparkeria sp. TaxID=2035736 RepID=UPI003569C3A7